MRGEFNTWSNIVRLAKDVHSLGSRRKTLVFALAKTNFKNFHFSISKQEEVKNQVDYSLKIRKLKIENYLSKVFIYSLVLGTVLFSSGYRPAPVQAAVPDWVNLSANLVDEESGLGVPD